MSTKSAQAVRRLPLRQALDFLQSSTGEASGSGSTLRSNVKSLTMRFIPRNAESGPREFLKSYAPRIAYSNPSIPINILRIRDPRSGEKSKDPQDPNKQAEWAVGEAKPTPEMVVDFADGTAQTLSLAELSGSAIHSRLMSVAGGESNGQA